MRIDKIQQEMIKKALSDEYLMPEVGYIDDNRVLFVLDGIIAYVIPKQMCYLDLGKFAVCCSTKEVVSKKYEYKLEFTDTLHVTPRCCEMIFKDSVGRQYRVNEELLKHFVDDFEGVEFWGISPVAPISIKQGGYLIGIVSPIANREDFEQEKPKFVSQALVACNKSEEE